MLFGDQSNGDQQEIMFRLRDLPTWNTGGKCSHIRIYLPIERSIGISEISIPEVKNIIPTVILQSADNEPPDIFDLTVRARKISTFGLMAMGLLMGSKLCWK